MIFDFTVCWYWSDDCFFPRSFNVQKRNQMRSVISLSMALL